jgi:hypothetical protein
MIGESIEFEETQFIVYFLQDCAESLQLVDGLRLLFNMLCKPVKFLMNHLETLGGLKVLLCGVSKDEGLREMTLKTIGKYLQQSSAKQTQKLLADYASSLYSEEASSLTVATYYCMIEILIDDYSLDTSSGMSVALHSVTDNFSCTFKADWTRSPQAC